MLERRAFGEFLKIEGHFGEIQICYFSLIPECHTGGSKKTKKQQQQHSLAMAEDLESKTKRVRDLLSSFYGEENDLSPSHLSRRDTIHAINSKAFDAERYMSSLVRLSFTYLIHSLSFIFFLNLLDLMVNLKILGNEELEARVFEVFCCSFFLSEHFWI